MRVVAHLASSNPDTLADLGKMLQTSYPDGDAEPHGDGRGLDFGVAVALIDGYYGAEANRLVLALSEALRPAVAAGAVVQLEVSTARADRMHMTTHVGLAFGPDLLAKLGAWGIALAVTTDLA